MKKVWCYNEEISLPGHSQTVKKEYWVDIVAIPKRWWSIKEWQRANSFLNFLYKES